MTLLDAGVIIITLLFLIRGIWIGLVRQLASIAALVLGFVAAGRYYRQLSELAVPFIDSPKISFIVTYALLFLVVYLLTITVGFGLKKVMTLTLLGWFDRFMGGLFGLVKAVFVVTLLFMLLSGFLDTTSLFFKGSFSLPYLSRSSDFFLNFLKDKDLQSHFLRKEPAISSLLPIPVPAGETNRGKAE